MDLEQVKRIADLTLPDFATASLITETSYMEGPSTKVSQFRIPLDKDSVPVAILQNFRYASGMDVKVECECMLCAGTGWEPVATLVLYAYQKMPVQC